MNNTKETAQPCNQVTLEDLLKRQSVRATFKLPQEMIDLLGMIAQQLGIKQKSLLDQLTEDPGVLSQLARQAQYSTSADAKKRQKTFVISKSTLNSINSVARKQNISRDKLVEYSIRRLEPLIEKELEKHHRRKDLLNEMRELLSKDERLLEAAGKQLGKDDLLYVLLERKVESARKYMTEADSIISRGLAMEQW